MMRSRQQSIEKTCWQKIAGAGLLLLVAFLINLAGMGESFAHSSGAHSASYGHHAVSLDSSQNLVDVDHLAQGHVDATTLSLSPSGSDDCDCCCPFGSTAVSAALKPADHDYALQLATSSQTYELPAIFVRTLRLVETGDGDIPKQAVCSSVILASAQNEFVQTVRLLV